MSQQEFFQEQQFERQEQRPLDEHEIDSPQQPYYWSTKPNTQGLPKDEPASRYDEPMLQNDTQSDYQHGYHGSIEQGTKSVGARFIAPQGWGERPSSVGARFIAPQTQRQHFSPDGDAFERHYRPYGAYKQANNQPQWSAPWWARPQQHRSNPMRLFWLLLLGLIFIKPLLFVIGGLLAVVGVLIVMLVLPFLLVAMMMVPYLLFRAVTGRPLWSYWRGRGPFWW